MQDKSLKKYLESSEFIDFNTPEIIELAKKISQGLTKDQEVAKVCYEYVRDEIKHSADYSLDTITCKASEVLHHKTGYCYAKSHLLAALLRANNIPCGLCYQRLSLDGAGSPYSLHGLNAIYLKEFGWYRVDSRGNKEGVNAQFVPPHEQLAFSPDLAAEKNIQGIWHEPLDLVIKVLQGYDSYKDVDANLPDIEVY